jgi:hypothetical protein
MTRISFGAFALLATVLLTSCSGSGGAAGGGGLPGSETSAPCEVLTSADEMRSIVESTDLLGITNVRFGNDDGVLRDIACGVGNDGDRAVAVGLSVPVHPCTTSTVFDLDPDNPAGWYGTATNGGLFYAMCTPDGGTLQATYISRLDVPGPSLAQLHDIVASTMAQLDDLRQIALATLEDDAPDEPEAEPGCLPVPDELSAAGLEIEGCILDVSPNDNGGSTIQTAVDGPDAFTRVSDALTALGMETVFCGEDPRSCGWSTSDGTYNANVTFWEAGTSPSGSAEPVIELETWGF